MSALVTCVWGHHHQNKHLTSSDAAAVVLEVLEVEVDNQQSWLHCPIRELGTNLLQT